MGYRLSVEEKTRRAAERKAHTTSLKPGDIMVSSWGYDQTNIDYYQVVAVVGRVTVQLRKLAKNVIDSTGFMTEKVTPAPGEFVGEAFRARVSPHDYISLTSYSGASKWDGQPDTATHYA